MNTLLLIAIAVALLWFAWWWFVARNRPVFPPLDIADDDPLMLEASRKAKETVPRMLELFPEAQGATNVKIPFVTSSGNTEHLWAELLSVDGANIRVRYMTPPVTHTGRLEREQIHALGDIEDWVIAKDGAKYVGGYTMRVMFKRGRELWGTLPPELQAEESKYESE